MNESKRMTSIARAIGRSSWRRQLFAFIKLDIIIAVLIVGVFCCRAERMSEQGFQLSSRRSFVLNESMPISRRMDGAVYVFTPPDGERISVESGDYFVWARYAYSFMLICEGLLLIGQMGAGRRSANRLLRPLRDMTANAQQLTRASFDARKYRDLENAIASISPSAPDATLSTGERELEGLEHAVNSLIARMREAYAEQTRFVSDASHELRTPIAVIQGYADMLDRWGKSDPGILDESIAAIKGEASHMSKLVEQLLFLARGDSGRTRLTLAAVDLAEMMREVCEEYEMIDEKHHYSFSGDKAVASGDAALLKQAARILVDNAVKYTPQGGKISLRAHCSPTPTFEVRDEGIGMSEEDVKHIFERFFRSDPARERSSGGTGLGLSIAKWIVDAHDGYFTVLSREGLGTRISVSLHAERSVDPAAKDATAGDVQPPAHHTK